MAVQFYHLFETENRGAEFSDCGRYRFALWRIWNDEKPLIAFIGLNPSTADAIKDDPTIRRVKHFANAWGYGGFYMLNLFAIISPDPSVLISHPDPLGGNLLHLRHFAKKCEAVCFAWGSFPESKKMAETVSEMFSSAVCLGINKDGSPRHPLYVKGKTKQVNFK